MIKFTSIKRTSSFTLVELLVVIAIIGILASLTIVSISSSRAKAKDTKIKSNMSAIGSGLSQYHVDQSAVYPDSNGLQVDVNDTLITTALTSYFAAQPVSEVFVFSGVTTGYGTPAGGATYLAAAGLNSPTEVPVTSGNGVYQTNGGGNAGQVDANGLTLSNINSGANNTESRAFITYGPQ